MFGIDSWVGVVVLIVIVIVTLIVLGIIAFGLIVRAGLKRMDKGFEKDRENLRGPRGPYRG